MLHVRVELGRPRGGISVGSNEGELVVRQGIGNVVSVRLEDGLRAQSRQWSSSGSVSEVGTTDVYPLAEIAPDGPP